LVASAFLAQRANMTPFLVPLSNSLCDCSMVIYSECDLWPRDF
jgi:hypothetical protein